MPKYIVTPQWDTENYRTRGFSLPFTDLDDALLDVEACIEIGVSSIKLEVQNG